MKAAYVASIVGARVAVIPVAALLLLSAGARIAGLD
jgi:hypothetical protein